MNAKKLIMAVTLGMFLFVLVGLVVDQACAAAGGAAGLGSRDELLGGGDKGLASKQGFDVLQAKKADPNRVPSKLKKVVGFGSIFVMIAVVKWL